MSRLVPEHCLLFAARPLCFLLWAAPLLLAPAWACADEVKDLFVAEVRVQSQDASELARGARQAMNDVLVRVSGDTAVARDPAVRRALSSPERYYYQFSYESRRVDPLAAPGTGAGGDQEPGEELWLRIRFEPSAISQLLRGAGLPVWGAVRPNLLVWLVVETAEGRIILGEEASHPAGEALVDRARVRGLPILFPLLDLEDKGRITATTLWGGFHEEIDYASQRYGADSVLAGRIHQGLEGEWLARWSYRVDGRWYDFETVQLRLESLVDEGVDRVADRLAARYSISSARGSIWVEVEAVDSLEDYVALSRYLEDLAPVQELFVERVSGSDILFRLAAEGTTEQMVQLIALDRRLFLLAERSSGGERHLHYRWLE